MSAHFLSPSLHLSLFLLSLSLSRLRSRCLKRETKKTRKKVRKKKKEDNLSSRFMIAIQKKTEKRQPPPSFFPIPLSFSLHLASLEERKLRTSSLSS